MKTTITLLSLTLLAVFTNPTFADEYVNGYLRSDGTYVQGHYRSNSDNSYNNNYSTQGNYNPHTGESGSQSRTWNDRTPQYNQKQYGNSGRIDSGKRTTPYFYNPNN